jgi:SAM-dependent methyltransferase
MTKDYLVELLTAYWFAPPVALWRAIELRAAGKLRYERPLLDLGCGDGLIGRVLFGSQGQADVGLDPWIDQLRRAAKLDIYRRVDQGGGDALPYPNGYFSMVFSNSVLEHIPDVMPVVHEVTRVLRAEGRFIFTVPSDAFRRMLDGYLQRMEAGDPEGAEAYARAVDERLEHHHYHTPTEWEVLLSDAGMSLLTAEYYMPQEVERFWDRMNHRYGVSRRPSAWRLLASPRLRPFGYQRLLRRLIVNRLRRCWRSYYEMDVPRGAKGGGLLVVAQRKE